MSESAEPASEAAEVKESEEQAQVAEDQQEQQEQQEQQQEQQTATFEADDEGNEAEAKGEAAEARDEEVAEEVSEQEQVRAQEEELTDEPAFEREKSEPKEEAKEQNNEEKQDSKALDDSQDTMQLPMIDTSQGAIEDEEMPSMVTISSLSCVDESEINIKHEEERRLVEEESISQSNPAKDNEDSDDSVCVIDDDDDEEEDEDDNRERRHVQFEEDEEGSSYSDDEEDDDDDDESEESGSRTHNFEKRRDSIRIEQDDEYDEEDDDEPEDGEDMEDNYEPDHYDGGSDHFELRHSNGLTKDSKERSASLQNIHVINTMNKVNVNPFSQKARMERNQTNSDNRVKGKQYAHVGSKVKKYIQDLSEQRRLSTENRKKLQEEARYRQQQRMNEHQFHRNEEIVTSKTIKDYTEKGLQEVAECEEELEEMYQLPQSLENGEISIFPSRRSMGNSEKLTRPDDDGMDVDPIDMETIRHDEKVDRINGAAITERKGIHRREENSKLIINGEDPSSTVSNLRTLTYEEYMKGSIAKGISEEIIEDDDEEIQEALTPPVYNDNGSNILRIDNVTRIYRSEQQVDSFHDQKTPPRMVSQGTETPKLQDPEIGALRMQLQNRNTQFESLRDAYQKTVSENMAMKVELDNLRKMVTYLQEQNKLVPETKTMAIQTEVAAAPRSMPTLEIDSEVPADPRFATTSINSAMSSQWTDSIGSALVSMEPPPNVTNALNSDESNNQTSKTPSKQKNAFSRAFMTSSRILQTLSNITHGRTKLNRQSKERARKLSASEKEPSAEVAPSNPKKRKATDTMELSSSAQPFKIPHREQQKTSNAQEPETVELADEEEQNSAAETDNPSEIDLQQMVINSDDVKVFVYPEDETGQEQSFLIQAQEISSNTKPGVRECGPYLLGNVEVYMTEMNGTINIWGKEVNQSSATSQNADELETSTRSKDLKSGLRWQSTPRIFNEGSASTSKKSRVIPRFTQQQKQHLHEVHNTMIECDGCHSHGQRLSWPSCSHGSQRDCYPSLRVDEMHCGCGNHRNNSGSCCRSNRVVEPRRLSVNDASPCCCHGGHSVHSGHAVHGGHSVHGRSPAQPEPYTSHQPFVRRHSFEPTDDEENAEESLDEENEQYTSKASHLNEDNSAHSCSNSKLAPPSSNGRRGSGENSDGSLFINDSDPLLGQRQIPDGENNKRRPRGKKVRGLLMDLLKGCGDCRTSNPMNKTNLQHNASVYVPSTSAQHKIACSPNQLACSLRSGEKCSSCRAGTDKTAEFEAQLESFRSQMDKLRTRSDNLREMLDTLRKDNAN